MGYAFFAMALLWMTLSTAAGQESPTCDVLALQRLYAALAQDGLVAVAVATPDAQAQHLAQQLRIVTSQLAMLHADMLRYQGEAARWLEQAKALTKDVQSLQSRAATPPPPVPQKE